MMQFFGALILFMTLSAVCGLRCYQCTGYFCTDISTCPAGIDRCSYIEMSGEVSKGCLLSALCISPIECCEKDLCNSGTGSRHKATSSGAVPTGSSVLLLLVSSAIVTLFL